MGYTNYWSQPTDFTDKEWDLVKREYNYIREIAGDKIEVQFVHNAIVFDGAKGNSCETFVLCKNIEDYRPSFLGDYELLYFPKRYFLCWEQ